MSCGDSRSARTGLRGKRRRKPRSEGYGPLVQKSSECALATGGGLLHRLERVLARGPTTSGSVEVVCPTSPSPSPNERGGFCFVLCTQGRADCVVSTPG